jgi:iron complex outermembrane receptor protein
VKRSAALLLALCLPVSVAVADEDSPAPQGPVETIEVRGTAEGPATLDTTAFATVIRAEDFAGRVTSVPELLRDAVGVQVRSLGGEFATVSIRGSSAEQVVVYLDGVPLNRALGGGVNLADLPLGQVESIEVYRGFTPAGVPAASIGGAILIRTRRASTSPVGSASASFGSFGSGEAIASLSGTRGRGDYAFGFDGARSGGDFEYLNNNGTPHDPSDDRAARRVNNDFRRGHLSGRFTVKGGPRARFSLATDLFARDQGVPGLDCCLSPRARFTTTRLLLRPELEVPGLAGGRLLAKVAADYTRYREEFDDPRGLIGLSGRNVDDITLTESFGAEAGLVVAASARQAVSILASRRQETADLEDRALPGPSGRGTASRRTITVTLEDQISFGSDRLVINPSLRHESYDSAFRPGPAGGVVVNLPADRRTTGKVGFRLRATDALTIKGNFGRFLRLPDFIELFGNRGSVLGNPALRPESGRSLDLGVAFAARRPSGGLLRQAHFEATLFETVAEDLIQFVPNSQGTVRALNIDRARIRGVELSLAVLLGPRFTGSLNATHQRPVDTSGRYTDGRILPVRPQDEVSAGAALDVGPGRIFYGFTYVGRNFVDPLNTPSTALPARYLHDLGYRARLRRGLQGTIEIKNLADERTLDVARFPLPGRSVHGRLAWDF